MSKHFTSVLRVEEARGAKETGRRVTVNEDRKTVALSQPHPLSPEQQPLVFAFDRIYLVDEDDNALYKHSIKDVVESTLLGYNGTVLFFGSARDGSGTSQLGDATTNRTICKAAAQIFRCLKKSRRSKSQSASNLVVLSSFVMVVDESIHDLLHGFLQDGGSDHDVVEFPKLSLVNGTVIKASVQEVNTTSKVVAVQKYGSQMRGKILQAYGKSKDKLVSHHTIFTLTVEYAQFGSMNSPISGNLSFVDVGRAGPLAHRQRHTTRDEVDKSVVSLFTFADVIDSLTLNISVLQEKSGSVMNLDNESTLLPCVPSTETSELYKKSVLTQLLKEALGGNCKTLLVCYTPEEFANSSRDEVYESLKLASKARMVQNTPNKRDLAEKALMSAYMKELQLRYGDGWIPKDEKARAESMSAATSMKGETAAELDSREKELPKSQDLISREENVGVTYNQVMTMGEQRELNVEMAVTALVAAALAGGGEESEEEEEEEEENEKGKMEKERRRKAAHRIKLTKRRKKQHKQHSTKDAGELDNVSTVSTDYQEITVDALVGILQDPDKGVPRALTTALKDVKIRKDAGALFCGADIVRWMVENVAGVEGEGDAERLGQLLLDKGAIFHSEGSTVFANAETLFYYARDARPTNKPLSREEIEALLAHTSGGQADKKSQLPEKDREQRRDSTTLGEDPGNEVIPLDEVNDTDSGDDELHIERTHDISLNAGLPVENGSSELESQPPENSKAAREEPQPPEAAGEEANLVPQYPDTFPGSAHPPLSSSSDIDQLPPVEGSVTSEGPAGTVHPPLSSSSDIYLDQLQRVEGSVTSEGPAVNQNGEEGPMVCTEEEQLELEEEEPQNGVTGEPNTAPVERIPSIHTFESTEEYPHPLHMAVAIGKHPGVIKNLVMMFGVDKCDEFNRTPLMFAAKGNKKSSCTALVDCGADVNRQDSSGLTALHVACYHGNKEATNVLLSKRAAVDIRDKMGHSALHWSTVPANHNCLQLILSRALPDLVDCVDRSGLTALHWAIYYDHPQHLKLLLRKYQNHSALDSEGRTLVTYAIERRAANCMKMLLMVNPQLLALPDCHGCTPLHYASTKSSPEYIKLLTSDELPTVVNLDINSTDQYGHTPLHCAVACNQPQNAMILMSNGAQVNVIDKEGKSPMDYAEDLKEGSEMIAILKGELLVCTSNSSSEPQSPSSKVCSIL